MNKIQNLIHNKWFLPLVIALNSIILLFNLLFVSGRVQIYAYLFVSLTTFYLNFLLPIKNKKWLDVLLVFVSFAQSSVSSLLLIVVYNFLDKHNYSSQSVRTQVINNFSIPFLIMAILWIVQRLPVLLKISMKHSSSNQE